ncbi:MAG: hypothetical protein Q4G59_03415, partial [Planctomycetia bacterium]|nr:hypothetical protein [Planctomycetia bacterium]
METVLAQTTENTEELRDKKFRKRLYGVFSFFFMFLVVVSVFFAMPSRSEAQPPSKAPALK